MLRVTVLSLLLGATALIIGLTQFFTTPNSARQQAPALVWDAATARVLVGTPSINNNELQLKLDSTGTGLVSLDAVNIDTADFSFIHLSLEEPATSTAVAIIWKNAQETRESHSYTVEDQTRHSLWLATEELRSWTGELGSLSLSFSGHAGDTVLIRDFSIFPASATRKLLAIGSDLTGYAPWNTAAMNTYTGAFNSSSFYPIVLAVALLVLGLLAYGLLVFIFRKKLRFDLAVVALIFLSTWIVLDMLWQYRLLHQLADTHRLFAGKNTEERLAVGPDAELYKFISNVKPRLASTDSRIFVTSDDTYSGMRAAYYFYPSNVYWSLYGAPLPHMKHLRKGDYIVLVNPSLFTFDPVRELVIAPKRRDLDVELVFSDSSGTVVRLK